MTKPHQADITRFITSLMEGTDSPEERGEILSDLDSAIEVARATFRADITKQAVAFDNLAAISQEIGEVTMAQPKKKSTRKTKIEE